MTTDDPDQSPGRRQRKTAEARKAEIVETAIRLAAEVGPDRLTTQQLAHEIGITQPAIFKHFPTKAEIWQAVGERISTFLSAGAETAPDLPDPPEVRLVNLVRRHLTFIRSNPAIPAILFSRELHAENDKLRRLFERLMQNRQQVFRAVIEQGIASGRFRADLDADVAAGLYVALVQGQAMRWSLSARSFDLVAEGGAMAQLLLAGFYAPKG
ncbi:MAG: TetR/AcrR family transcriptional regulator [Rhodobacteraceae bacterium]|nr:TetR/AcrR family transcriptional regulator [Paracoccaceae bacterium]